MIRFYLVCLPYWIFVNYIFVRLSSGLFLEQTQAYIYILLIASGIDKIHNCPKCLKEKHSKPYAYIRNPVWIETAL
jgi:hypothetical protein